MIRGRLLSVRILLVSAAAWLSAQDTELNTLLFQTTFKVEGRRDGRGPAGYGTVFLMGRPIPDTTRFRIVLITARHVLEGISGDMAILNLRRRINRGRQRVRYPIRIRDAGQPLCGESR